MILNQRTNNLIKSIYNPAVVAIASSLFYACGSETNKSTVEDKTPEVEHVIIYSQPGRFAGWPANNGAFIYEGNEIIVGFTEAGYVKKKGHNAEQPYLNWLARSTDGGLNWTAYDPENYAGDFGAQPDLKKNETELDFTNPGFVMRVIGAGYHGADDGRSHFFYSYDRGLNWQGPFSFGDLLSWPELRDNGLDELTPRTDYIVMGSQECLLFFSARKKDTFASDRLFCIKTTDGGKTFQFHGWVIGLPHMAGNDVKVDLFEDKSKNPGANECRAVMSQSVQLENGTIVSAIRRKYIAEDKEEYHWIDVYHSKDGGETWNFLSKVAETGGDNGNPPAMTTTADGRLCVVFGERDKGTIQATYSEDEGKTWTQPFVLIDEFWSEDMQMNDLGYPRVVRREDGKMVAIYYYSTKSHLHHLRASIWEP